MPCVLDEGFDEVFMLWFSGSIPFLLDPALADSTAHNVYTVYGTVSHCR